MASSPSRKVIRDMFDYICEKRQCIHHMKHGKIGRSTRAGIYVTLSRSEAVWLSVLISRCLFSLVHSRENTVHFHTHEHLWFVSHPVHARITQRRRERRTSSSLTRKEYTPASPASPYLASLSAPPPAASLPNRASPQSR